MKKKPIISIFLCILSVNLFIGCSNNSPSEPDQTEIPFGYDRNFDYLSILKNSPNYDYESTEDYPVFMYQDTSDVKLTELRNTYDLKNIAGTGDEWSRIINLFKWVHRTLKHDGGNIYPESENSLGILKYCEDTDRGVNCVMMAIVLNEVYLSMGFKSRLIHGNSKKFVFNGEWHAFNIVYSNTHGKWVYIDPTFQAYYKDDNGNLLSVAEIREYMRQDKPLHLNVDADYNGNSITENDNLHYLSKNFYRFSCSLNSAFDSNGIFHTTNTTSSTFCHLDPENEKQNGRSGAENYYMSNPDYFWSKP